ncbi:MAG: hypothetical protein ACFFKA_02545, partial [Candidatus Thorarchaeota archaeon]
NKVDLLKGDREKKLDDLKNKITTFFNKRKIAINEFFETCGETVETFEDIQKFNNQVAEMILEITTMH